MNDPLALADKMANLIWTLVHRSKPPTDEQRARIRELCLRYRRHRRSQTGFKRILDADILEGAGSTTCEECCQSFFRHRKTQRFCCTQCKKRWHRKHPKPKYAP